MKKLLLFAEIGFVVLAITFFSGALGIGGDPTGVKPGLIPNGVQTGIRYLIWFVSTLLLVFNGKRTLFVMSRDWLLWVFIALAFFSFAWSDFLTETLLNSREILQMASFGLYFATRFDLKQQVKLIALSLGVGAVLSFLVALALPTVGRDTMDHPGAWQGIYDYKNTLGSMMVMASIAFSALPIKRPIDRWLKWMGIALATALILLSTSKTALVLSIAMMLLLPLYSRFRWQGKLSVVWVNLGLLTLCCVGVGVLGNWVELLEGLGRDGTFSGRTYIWSVALSKLMERPLLGFGRASFWAVGSPYPREIGAYLSDAFRVPHAHNGFVETALDVGLLGLTLFLICYVTAYIAALKRAYVSKRPEYLWAFGFLTFLALNNMTESFILRLANIYLVLFIATALTIKQPVAISDEELETEQLSEYGSLPMRKEQT